jgi:thioredoxin-related protein
MTVRIGACLLFLIGGMGLVSRSARAEEVLWRKSYNDARKEAAAKNKPLLLDFGTENCHWCNRLDSETFRDPAVLAVLNKQFVAYRVDGQRDARLLDALNIQSFPTLVFAAPDGKILGTQEGYVDPVRFRDELRRALAMVAAPETMLHDYDEAAKAIAAADYSRAIALLKSITEDGKDRPVQVKARNLLLEIEQQASGRLASARRLAEKGLKTEAIATATETSRVFAGSQAAKDAGPLVATWTASLEMPSEPRARKARELLALAREEYRGQHYLECLDDCEMIAAHYSDLEEGSEAAQLAAGIKNNPEWMKQACDKLGERLALDYMTLAESYLRKGQPRQAVASLQRVVQMFPGTRQAEAARTRLAQIQAEPAGRIDTKKP